MIETKQKNSTDILTERMNAGFPGGERATKSIGINEMPLTISIDELDKSFVLSRKKRNALYDDIKASIREKGLDHAPVITKMPGQDAYVILDGGNTRLQILKELYQETGDKKFYYINCIFRPWQGELKSIVGHLIENGLRDDYTFIEKSIGILKAKNLYESEDGNNKNLSSRELSELLKKDGYPISHVLISKMLNTMEYLYPYMPQVLELGLSRNQVEKILLLRKSCEEAYNQNVRFTDDLSFIEGFNLILTSIDTEPTLYNFEHLKDEMFGFFSNTWGVQYNLLELIFENNEQGKKSSTILHQKPSEPINESNVPETKVFEPINESNVPETEVSEPINENNVSGTKSSESELVSQDLTISSHEDVSNSPSEIVYGDQENKETKILQQVEEEKPVIPPSGEIIVEEANLETIVNEYKNATDFTEIYPRNYSLTLNLAESGLPEKKPIVDIWKLSEGMTNHEYIFSDIAGHVHDIFQELDIDKKTMDLFSIDREKRKTVIDFNPLSKEDATNVIKQTAYQLLVAILTDKPVNIQNVNYLITNFNDFVVIKFLRIIRLKRVYDELLQEYLKQK